MPVLQEFRCASAVFIIGEFFYLETTISAAQVLSAQGISSFTFEGVFRFSDDYALLKHGTQPCASCSSVRDFGAVFMILSQI